MKYDPESRFYFIRAMIEIHIFDFYFSAVAFQQSADDGNGRTLARTVYAEKRKKFSAGNGKRDIVDRFYFSVIFFQMFDFDCMHIFLLKSLQIPLTCMNSHMSEI